jgi:hypothetical protein
MMMTLLLIGLGTAIAAFVTGFCVGLQFDIEDGRGPPRW